MSLIQDALKRQQEETENARIPLKDAAARPAVPPATAAPPGNAVTTTPAAGSPPPRKDDAGSAEGVAPSVPDTMPLSLRPSTERKPRREMTPPVVTARKAENRSWKKVAGIVFFILLLIWSGGLLFGFFIKQPDQNILEALMQRLALSRFIPGAGTAPVESAPVAAPVAAEAKPEVAAAPAAENAPEPLPWISPAAAAAPAFADEEEEDELASLPEKTMPDLPAALPKPAPVIWPRLKLTAVFAGSDRAGARLNNRFVVLGDKIEGVTLLEIHQNSVVLKCGTETRRLKIGTTLN